MTIMRSAGGGGIVLLGTLVMGIGFILSLSTPLTLGRTSTVELGLQMKELGFMLIVVGFVAGFIMYALRELRVM